jgi:peptidoglycan/xylan/chitin deacetylase (PgdA/CDA1 family)
MTVAMQWVVSGASLAGLAGVAFFLSRHTLWRLPRPKVWPRILMYHRVTDGAPASGMNTPPALFEKHLLALKAQKKVFCTLSELADRCHQQEKDNEHLVALTFDDGWLDNFEEMFPLLQKHGAKATIYLAPECPDIPKLRPEHIRAMRESGLVEFGAHTVNHVNLKRSDDGTARAEIKNSRQAVEMLTGVPCRSFAYPYGQFSQKHCDMVRAAGFDTAVSTKKEIRPWWKQNRFRLCRISTHGQASMFQFKISLSRGRYRI